MRIVVLCAMGPIMGHGGMWAVVECRLWLDVGCVECGLWLNVC